MKRARSLTKTAEGREALRKVLGLNLEFAEYERIAMPKGERPVVAVLVPTRDVPKRETQDAFAHLQAFSQSHCDMFPRPARVGPIVHWLRNDMLVELHKCGQHFDYVLFMDDDMKPGKDDAVRLLAHGKEVIGAATVARPWPNLPTFKFFNRETMSYQIPAEWKSEGDQEGLLKVDAIGAGFSLYSRKALDAAAEYYLSCQHEQKYLGMTTEFAKQLSEKRRNAAAESGNCWWFECLKQPNGGGEYGEDVSLCFKFMECGIEMFVDTTVRTGHIGEYAFRLDDFYLNRDVMREQAKG